MVCCDNESSSLAASREPDKQHFWARTLGPKIGITPYKNFPAYRTLTYAF
jgi:hypothetical protein